MKSREDGITELTINACQSTRTCNYQLVDWNTTKTDDVMHIFYGEIPFNVSIYMSTCSHLGQLNLLILIAKHIQYILKNNCLQCIYAFKAIKSEEKKYKVKGERKRNFT